MPFYMEDVHREKNSTFASKLFSQKLQKWIVFTITHNGVSHFVAFVCPPMCVCVRTCSCPRVCVCVCVCVRVCRRACLSTCMCMYSPRFRSPANRWRQDRVGHRGDGHRCGGLEPGSGRGGVGLQQRGDRPGCHSRHHRAESRGGQSKPSFQSQRLQIEEMQGHRKFARKTGNWSV